MSPEFSPQILPNRAVIRLAGENVQAFLHNLLTCDVERLGNGQTAYGALLSPQGKIQHELFVHVTAEAVHLDCVRNQRDALIKKLIMYRLRAKIEIVASDDKAVAVGRTECAPDPRLATLGPRGIIDASGMALISDHSYTAACIAQGLADGEQDIGENRLFPHEANFDFLNGVNFKKGCYVGQEVVSRMQHRASARTRILPVSLDGPALPENSEITSGETKIGTLLSSMGKNALALMRLDRLSELTEPLLTHSVRLHVRKPDWMPIDINIPKAAQ